MIAAYVVATVTPQNVATAAAMVQDLGARLAASAASPYTFRWILVDSPQVNAMAAPGGYVIVFTGLLRAAQSPEEAKQAMSALLDDTDETLRSPKAAAVTEG